jgi:hypothetical protein
MMDRGTRNKSYKEFRRINSKEERRFRKTLAL